MRWFKLIGCSVVLLAVTSPVHATNTVAVTPPFQYLTVTSTATASAKDRLQGYTPYSNPQAVAINQADVEYSNHSDVTANLKLSLVLIHATDLYGRLQFNAPLPQSVIPADTGVATISPTAFSLQPGEVATATVTFNPVKIEPGKTAYLLLAETETASPAAVTGNHSVFKYALGSSIVIRDPINTVPHLELKQFSWIPLPITFEMPTFFTLGIKNSGTGPGQARGIIQITDSFHRELVRGPLNETDSVILPGSERLVYTHAQVVTLPYPLSLCTLKITGYDELKQTTFNLTKRFIYLNPLGLGIALGIICLAGIGCKQYIKRKHHVHV